VSILIVLGLVADVVFGFVIRGRGSCETSDGIEVRFTPSPLPLSSALLTGAVGTVDALLPWGVLEVLAEENSPEGVQLSLSALDGYVIAETSAGPLPVLAVLEPGIDEAGGIDVTVVGLSVAGREVPPELAEQLGDLGGPLQTGTLLGGLGTLPFAIEDLSVDSDGLNVTARVPLSAISGAADGSECGVPR
jgi:hypothetical protein